MKNNENNNKFEEKIQGEYGVFQDIFKYVDKTSKKLISSNNAIEKENKLVLDNMTNMDYFLEAEERISKLLADSAKDLNKISNEYEEEMGENKEFRSKSINSLLSSDNHDDEVLGLIVKFNKYFEEKSSFIENYINMYIKTTNDFPVSDDSYGKSVKKLLIEYNRILNNLKLIRMEINDLKN